MKTKMPSETEMLAMDVEYYKDVIKTAMYQIRWAAAQLEIAETNPLNVYKIRDAAQAVLAQIRAYLEEQE